MIHSMAVAVDSTESSQQAQIFALSLAKRFGATVSGIAVLDTPWIKRPMATPIGGGAYRAHRDETITAQRMEELDQKINAFRARCDKEGVTCYAMEMAGSPAEMLDHEAEQHDLLILGRDTNFHGIRGHDIGDTTEQLLKDHPRPIIVVPPALPAGGSGIVVSFDGSLGASRAMQMVYLLGLTKGETVHVVSVVDDLEIAARLAERGAAFFKERGIDALAHGLQEHDDTADAILHIVESLDAGMLVMGAFGEHGLLQDLFGSSVTKQLLRACPVPAFVAY